MQRSILALAAVVIVAASALTIMSWESSSTPSAKTKPALPTTLEQETTSPETTTWNEASTHTRHARSNTNRTLLGEDIAPLEAAGITGVPGSRGPRKTATPVVRAPWTPRTSGSQVEFLTDALFRQLDANGDGVLTGGEIPTALRGEANARGEIDREAFARLFQAAVQTLRASQPATGTRQITMPAWYETLDTDRDGRVSLASWRAAGRSDAEFRQIDTNGDGFLTQREVLAFEAQPTAPMSTAISGTSLAGVTDPTSTEATPHSASKGKLASPPSRADALFSHYVMVASGSQPKSNAPTPTPPAPAKPTATSPVAHATTAPAKTSAKPAPPPPPPPEIATLPLPPIGSDHWVQRNTENMLDLLAGDRPPVLFLGDSITELLAIGSGKSVWDDFYAPLGSLDFAVGGFRTSHVLWQVETGQVALAAPKVVVLMVGTNNLTIGHTPEEAAAGVEKIVDELGAQLPNTRILLLSVLPRGARVTDPFRAKVAKLNGLIAELHDGARVTYLDIGGSFLAKDGSLSSKVMPDYLHPSLWGYQLYMVATWETLRKLMKP